MERNLLLFYATKTKNLMISAALSGTWCPYTIVVLIGLTGNYATLTPLVAGMPSLLGKLLKMIRIKLFLKIPFC